jgi:hypothetical protein
VRERELEGEGRKMREGGKEEVRGRRRKRRKEKRER